MKTSLKLITIACTTLFLATLTPTVNAAPPGVLAPAVGAKIQKPPPLIDNPIIQAFNALPAVVVQGDQVSLNWIVSPGPGGSPVSQVTISVDGTVIFSNPSPTFTHTRQFSWVGEKTFVLTARNAAGKTSTQSKSIRGVSMAEAMSKISIANMDANPQRFSPGQPIDFKVMINNTNPGLTIHPVNIFVTQGNRVVGNKTNTSLPPGTVMHSLQDSGFIATGGYYYVDLEFRGQHKNRTFMTKPVTMYTIDPTP
jgi:hypothetical protein